MAHPTTRQGEPMLVYLLALFLVTAAGLYMGVTLLHEMD